MDLRPYQNTLVSDVWGSWTQGARNVLMRLDTGGGKTVILAFLVNLWISQARGAVAVIAHRQELVSQLSMTLARHGVVHNIIASEKVRRAIIAAQIQEFGKSFFNPGSLVSVASVDTLIRVDASWFVSWCAQVTLWITDEGHHVVLDNKWHTAIQLFRNASVHGLLPTATPSRADGKGLGAHADGVAHAMVQGPPMRWLIEQKYLTDYRIICPDSDLVLYEEAGASGDWSSQQLKEASKRSHIVGDVVREYLRYGQGKLGITFTTDIETAAAMTQAYRAAGVRAETLTGKTDDGYRRQILRQYAARQIDQIVAVDIVSEGFDLPAIEVASLARPTQSLALYMQQFGRALRPLEGKSHALILDHAGNTLRHQGPPDKPRTWTLDRRNKRGGGGGIPMRICGQGWKRGHEPWPPCYQPFERFHTECPYCGLPLPEPEPAERGSPAAVDGDLVEMDAETLARLRAGVEETDMSLDDYRRWLVERQVSNVVYLSASKRHAEKQDAQATLRAEMETFVRRQLAAGLKDRQIHRKFYLAFGIDVLSARSLSRAEAEQLAEKVRNYVG